MDIKTSADRRLPNTDVVLAMLKWIERYMMHRKPRICATATFSTMTASPTAHHLEPIESQVVVEG